MSKRLCVKVCLCKSTMCKSVCVGSSSAGPTGLALFPGDSGLDLTLRVVQPMQSE